MGKKKEKKFLCEVTTPQGCAPIGGWGALVKYNYIYIWFTPYKPNQIFAFCSTNVNFC